MDELAIPDRNATQLAEMQQPEQHRKHLDFSMNQQTETVLPARSVLIH